MLIAFWDHNCNIFFVFFCNFSPIQWFVHNLGLFLKWFSKEIIQGIDGRFWIRCLGIYSTGFIFWDYFCINFCLSLNKSFCIFGPKDFLKGIEGFECTIGRIWMYRVHFLGLFCLVVFIRRHGSLNKERVSFKPQNYIFIKNLNYVAHLKSLLTFYSLFEDFISSK